MEVFIASRSGRPESGWVDLRVTAPKLYTAARAAGGRSHWEGRCAPLLSMNRLFCEGRVVVLFKRVS
jgi:hypothetical protein